MKARLVPMTPDRVHKKIVVLADLRKMNEKLQAECASLRKRLQSLTSSKREVEANLEKSRSLVSKLREELANVRDENSALKKIKIKPIY